MTDQFRALWAELAEELVNEYGYCTEWEKGLPLCESNVSELLTRARALLAQPEPEGPEGSYFTDGDYNREIHYAWELEDAEGEWQAGGSANRLDDVRREGSHYLQTYSQDGPHKLIIQRHCLSTIEEDCEV